jgi:hypothetical protein
MSGGLILVGILVPPVLREYLAAPFDPFRRGHFWRPQMLEFSYGDWMCVMTFIELAALSLIFEYDK